MCKFYAADTKAMKGKLKMESRKKPWPLLMNVLFLNFQFRKIVQSDHPGQIYTTHNTEFTTDK